VAQIPDADSIRLLPSQLTGPQPIDRETEHNLGAGARGDMALGTGGEHLGDELLREQAREEAKKKAQDDALTLARAQHEARMQEFDTEQAADEAYRRTKKEADADGNITGPDGTKRPWRDVLGDRLQDIYRGAFKNRPTGDLGRPTAPAGAPPGRAVGAGTETPTAPVPVTPGATPGAKTESAAAPGTAPAPATPLPVEGATPPGTPAPAPVPAATPPSPTAVVAPGAPGETPPPSPAPAPAPAAAPAAPSFADKIFQMFGLTPSSSSTPGAGGFDVRPGTMPPAGVGPGGEPAAPGATPGAGPGGATRYTGKVPMGINKLWHTIDERYRERYLARMKAANQEEDARLADASLEDVKQKISAAEGKITANPALYGTLRELVVGDINTRGDIDPIPKSHLIRDAEIRLAKAAAIGALEQKKGNEAAIQELQRAAYPGGTGTPPSTKTPSAVKRVPYSRGPLTPPGPLGSVPGTVVAPLEPSEGGKAERASTAPPPPVGEPIKEEPARPLPPPSPGNRMVAYPVDDAGKRVAGPGVPLQSGNIAFATDQASRDNGGRWGPGGFGTKQTGVITLPDANNPGKFHTYRAVSGGAGRGSGAYGTYTLGGPENHPNLGGTSFALNGGGATTDKAPGMQRPSSVGPIGAKIGQFVHWARGPATHGCIGIEGDETTYSRFVEDLTALQRNNSGSPVSITMAPAGAIRQEERYPTEALPKTRAGEQVAETPPAGLHINPNEPPTAIEYAAKGARENAEGKTEALGGPKPEEVNLQQAKTDLGLTPQETNLYQQHLSNLYGGGGFDQPNGQRSTLLAQVTEFDGKYYMLPTVWDGKQHTATEAAERAKAVGLDKYPSYDSQEDAEKRYSAIHDYMDKDVVASKVEAATTPGAPPDRRKEWEKNAELEATSGGSATAPRVGPWKVLAEGAPDFLRAWSKAADTTIENTTANLTKIIDAKEKFALENGVLPTPAEQAQVRAQILEWGNPALMDRWSAIGAMFAKNVELYKMPATSALDWLQQEEAEIRRRGGSENEFKANQKLQQMQLARQKDEYDNLLGNAREGFTASGRPGERYSLGPVRIKADDATLDQDIANRIIVARSIAREKGATTDQYEAPDSGRHAVLRQQFFTRRERAEIGGQMADNPQLALKVASSIVRMGGDQSYAILHELAPFAPDLWVAGNLMQSEKTGNASAKMRAEEIVNADIWAKANPKHENTLQHDPSYHVAVQEKFGSAFANAPDVVRERLRAAADNLVAYRASRNMYGPNAPTTDNWKAAADDLLGVVKPNQGAWFTGDVYGGIVKYAPQGQIEQKGGFWAKPSEIYVPNTVRATQDAVGAIMSVTKASDLLPVGAPSMEPYAVSDTERKRRLDILDRQIRNSWLVNIAGRPGVFGLVENDPDPAKANERKFVVDPNTGQKLVLDWNKMEPEYRRRLQAQGRTGVFINESYGPTKRPGAFTPSPIVMPPGL
jgi:hypothetical protein